MNPLSAIPAALPANFSATSPARLPADGPLQKPIPLDGAQDASPAAPAGQAPSSSAPAGFEKLFGSLIQDVEGKQAAANQAVNGLMSGQPVSLHNAMISMEEANLSFQLMVEVRNKLLDSYQELMRMQI